MAGRRKCAQPLRVGVRVLAVIVLSSSLIARTSSAQSGEVRYVYDELGRLTAVIDQSGEAATYHYDAVGNLLSITRSSASTVLKIVVFSPRSASIGALVTISGTGFSATPASNSVHFNGTSATVLSSTATEIIAAVPSGATSGLITVTTGGTTASSDGVFTVASSTAPTITSFSPSIGLAGTAVTITGTNFDAAKANDQIVLNTKSADVTSASVTSLGTVVPTGGTSGRVTVRTPAGSVSSSSYFFVPPSPYTATDVVTAEAMSLGDTRSIAIGTANKVALVAFDATAGQHLTFLFTTITPSVTSATLYSPSGATVLSQAFGSGASAFMDGTVTESGTFMLLVDPSGSATGSMNLALNSVVDLTGTITPGGSAVTVTTTAPGQRATLTFSGTAGQRISLRGASATFGGTCNVYTGITNPNGSTLDPGTCMGGTGGFMDVRTLGATGSYKLVVDPSAAAVGSLTLTLYDVPADVTGTVTAGGSPVTVTTTVPGQNGSFTFNGIAGQRIALQGTSGTYGGFCNIYADVVNPDASLLVNDACMGGSGGFTDVKTLPATGTYTIALDPTTTATGSLTLTLYDVAADVTGTIAPGGSSVTVTTTAPGQNASLTFSGTASQRVSLRGTSGTYGGICNVYASIKNPNGSFLVNSECMGGTGGFADVQTLGTTGTYTIVVDPSGTAIGSLTLTLYDVPADASAAISIGASAVTLTTTVPGQNALVTFSATAGQQVTLHFTGNTLGPTVYLRRPDNGLVAAAADSSSSFNLGPNTLPTTGTYTVTINPPGITVGSISVSVTTP